MKTLVLSSLFCWIVSYSSATAQTDTFEVKIGNTCLLFEETNSDLNEESSRTLIDTYQMDVTSDEHPLFSEEKSTNKKNETAQLEESIIERTLAATHRFFPNISIEPIQIRIRIPSVHIQLF